MLPRGLRGEVQCRLNVIRSHDGGFFFDVEEREYSPINFPTRACNEKRSQLEDVRSPISITDPMQVNTEYPRYSRIISELVFHYHHHTISMISFHNYSIIPILLRPPPSFVSLYHKSFLFLSFPPPLKSSPVKPLATITVPYLFLLLFLSTYEYPLKAPFLFPFLFSPFPPFLSLFPSFSLYNSYPITPTLQFSHHNPTTPPLLFHTTPTF